MQASEYYLQVLSTIIGQERGFFFAYLTEQEAQKKEKMSISDVALLENRMINHVLVVKYFCTQRGTEEISLILETRNLLCGFVILSLIQICLRHLTRKRWGLDCLTNIDCVQCGE